MILQPVFGIVVLVGFAWLISESRRKVRIREILLGLFVTALMTVVMLKVPWLRVIFDWLNRLVSLLEESTKAGTSFVFGYLGGGAQPFTEKSPGGSFIFAFQALPIVLVVSALSSLLFYWRILPVIVRIFAWIFEKTMRIGGAVALSAAANIFLGMVESPLFVRPYLKGNVAMRAFHHHELRHGGYCRNGNGALRNDSQTGDPRHHGSYPDSIHNHYSCGNYVFQDHGA